MQNALRNSIWILVGVALGASALQSQRTSPTIKLGSDLVEVPALVTTRKGELISSLPASAFSLTDNGVPQQLSLVPGSDIQPLALVVIVETGGAGGRCLADYRNLASILTSLIGAVDHNVALITFDSIPHLVEPFTPNVNLIAGDLEGLQAGDNGAGILDAVSFGVQLLRTEPRRYRRAILLFSETIDNGSSTSRTEALRLISDSNITIYSFAFSSTAAAVDHEASKFNRDQPGPARGCFSHDHTGDPTDAEYDGHYSQQVLDCISMLVPPLRLVTMAFLAVHDSLRIKTAKTLAKLSGGEFFGFEDAAELEKDLIRATHDMPNFYVLSFQPTNPVPGMHVLQLTVRDRPHLRVKGRTAYWVDVSVEPH